MRKLMLLLALFAFFHSHLQAQATEYTLIMDRVRADQQASVSGNISSLDNGVTTNLASLQNDGSWADISYAYSATSYTADTHLARVKNFALAYSLPTSSYYSNDTLFQAIIQSLAYWNQADPQSWNWYHNQISNPQRLGEIMIVLYPGPQLLPDTLKNKLLTQMNRGNPAAQTGANKLDVATHFIYRACLTANASLMQTGVTEAFNPISYTTAEGIQHDLSYQQHGAQLYIFGYGSVLVSGEINIATYLQGTSYALSGTKLTLLADFVRKGFLAPIRGRNIDFSVNGRSISRTNNLSQGGIWGLISKMKALDSANSAAYDQAIARLRAQQPPSYMITPGHTQFWRSDYTVHHRSNYFFGLRNVSTRTAKSENGNGENLKGYYLSDGATNTMVSGLEYDNIFPIWDWSRIPGTTVPYITTFPLRTAWGVNMGTAAFVGGASDSLYGVSTYAMNDYSTTAKKSWFFFDDEVVCLGAGITSTASQAINTTVEQNLKNGAVTVSANGTTDTVATGSYTYNNLKWIWHNNIGYYFPSGGNLALSTQTQTGNWKSINTGGSTTNITKNVFKLWVDHGTQPSNASYAYYVLPGKALADVQQYDTSAIRILANTSAVQAVKHKGLNIRQMVFFQAGTYTYDSVTITVDHPCAMILKNIGSSNVQVSIADPAQAFSQINVYLTLPGIDSVRLLSCSMPTGPYAGSTVVYTVNSTTPVYRPEGILPVADSYVRDGSYANDNYGGQSILTVKADGTGYTRETFLKFDLSGLTGSYVAAKLRLTISGANTDAGTTSWNVHYLSNDSWTETGLTWNNKPATGALLATQPGRTSGVVEWDISQQVISELAGDKILSLRVSSTTAGAKTDASFYSREASVQASAPRLILETSRSTTAIADAYVRNGTYGNTNYGSVTSLVLKKDGDGYAREAFVKFDVSNVPPLADTVKMRIYVNYANTDIATTGWSLYFVNNDSWTESGITWNNMPVTTSLIGTVTGKPAGNYMDWDVTGIAQSERAGDGILSLKLVSTTTGAKTDGSFSSRETADDLQKPTLMAYAAGGNPLLLSAAAKEFTTPVSTVKLFPNPVSGIMTIESKVSYDRAELRDARGGLMRSVMLKDQQKFQIDMTAFQQGIYFLHLFGKDGVRVEKVVKVK